MVRRTAEEAAATRDGLVAAALDVFGECGFAGATLEQIAARAGVTRGALYHHFSGKAEVYDAVLRTQADQVMGPLLARLSGEDPPLDRLRGFLMSYCRALERDERFRAVVDLLLFGGTDVPPESRQLTARGYEAWLATFRGVLEEARDRGELRAGLAPDDAARAVLALAAGATTATLQAPDVLSPSRAAESLVDVLFEGIAA